MGKAFRHGALVLAAVAATGAAASPASAAVTVGSDCVANVAFGPVGARTLVPLARVSPSPLPLTAPSSGVVTSWTVKVNVMGLEAQKLKVFRSTGNPSAFTAVGESGFEAIPVGTNVFKTRIPVQAGDRFGITSSGNFTPGCGGLLAGDRFGVSGSDAPLGSTTEFNPGIANLLPVSVNVEPDADADGYGDESQDMCTRSAKAQSECPLISLSTSGTASKGSAAILVTSSVAAPVTVQATVRVPIGMKNGKKGKAQVLTLGAPSQTVSAGQQSRFLIAFPQRLGAALKALSKKRALSLKATASTTDLGEVVSRSIVLRLRGQARPR